MECFTAGRLPALPLQMWTWHPLMVVLVLGGTAGQCQLGGHPSEGAEVTEQRVTPGAAVSVILFGSLFLLAAGKTET